MVLASDKFLSKNPRAAKAFVEASAQGWRDYLYGDPRPGDALIMKDNPEMTEDVLQQAREKMKSYGVVDGGDAKALGLGAMTDARWKTFFDMAAAQGVYPKDMDYKAAYTLDFVSPPVPK
jgi:NitT/TauT family transport system substrate-binding protein